VDAWTSGDGYESYIGRWSRLVAPRFLAWLDAPPGLAWLDVGCGTGALASTILKAAAPARVLGIDRSEAYLAHARQQVTDPRISFRNGDAQALPARDGEFEAVVSALALNFVPDPAKALSEFRRVLIPGGLVAVYVWDYALGMQYLQRFWDCAAELDANAAALKEGRRFALCNSGPLREALERAACSDVEVRPIDIPTTFRDFDDYWTPMLSGQGAAPAYVATLDDAARTRLRERLRESLPYREDGSIELVARAWAVRARR